MGEAPLPQKDEYVFARDRPASARLMFQHNALTRMQGWMLHPQVEAATNWDARIADVATGSGVWALELSEKYTDAEITAFDISDAQFPPKMSWPPNVNFELGNILEPVPQKYQGYFDVVHVRCIVGVIYNADKDFLMRNIISMLKPGGHIQWDELTEPSCYTMHKDGQMTTEMTSWMKRMYSVAGFRPATIWAKALPEILFKYGLEDVVGFEPSVVPSVLPVQSESLIWSCREVMTVAAQSGVPGAEEQLELAQKEIDDDIAAGDMWFYSWMVAVGKKPITGTSRSRRGLPPMRKRPSRHQSHY